MRIQHNIMAMNAFRNYNTNTSALGRNLEKLSSGYKINRAGDDAAGLAISEKMRAQISGLKQAQSNVKDGISLVKTAEGALQEVQDMLNRMTTLATQSANGTYDNDVDRNNLQKEVEALAKEIDRIADSSNFNGQKLLNGELSSASNLSTSTSKFASDEGGDELVVDFSVKANSKVTIGGAEKSLSFELAVDTGSAETKAAIDNTGKVTITLKKGADSSAETIQNAIKNANLDAITDTDEKAAVKAALEAAVVSGTGVTKGAGDGDSVTNKTATAAADTGKALVLQIGDTADSYNKLDVEISDMHTKALKIDTASINVKDQDSAASAIKAIKDAINQVSSTRGDLGAIQNRLEHTTNNLAIMAENIQDAESTIRDVDIADEMTAYTKNNILLQSAQAMLAQANQMPQGVLQLLQ
ncbi:MAG: flagellin [Oscillospiraceae bacterium]|nr:flagellin [Oscillospiraceae bacterium]